MPEVFVDESSHAVRKERLSEEEKDHILTSARSKDVEKYAASIPKFQDWKVLNTIFLTTQTYLLKVLVS